MPVWLWKFDLASRELSVALPLQTRLVVGVSIPASTKISVLRDGKELNDPYSSIIEIRNTGAKPILPSEIEGALNLIVDNDKAIVDAQLIDTSPAALNPSMTVGKQSVSIQPLLLNPGDSFVLSILTENGKPIFAPKFRIAGVSDVKILQESARPNLRPLTWLVGVTAPLAVCGAFIFLLRSASPPRIPTRPLAFFAALGSLLCGTAAFLPIWNYFFDKSNLAGIGFTLVLNGAALALALLFSNKRT